MVSLEGEGRDLNAFNSCGGADGERKRGAAVGVTGGGARRGVAVFAVRDDLLHLVEIFACLGRKRNAQPYRVKGASKFREDVALEGRGKTAKFDLLAAELRSGRVAGRVVLFEDIAKADARARPVDGDGDATLDIGL